LVDIIVDKDAFIESQVHPLMIEQAIQIMKDNPYPTRPKAKGKWQEIVILDSNDRLAMNCHKEHDKIVITGIKKLRKKKPLGPPRR
jgi:hypothetical protein